MTFVFILRTDTLRFVGSFRGDYSYNPYISRLQQKTDIAYYLFHIYS